MKKVIINHFDDADDEDDDDDDDDDDNDDNDPIVIAMNGCNCCYYYWQRL